MTEQQIKDGYRLMDGALAPPLDTIARVERRVASRRRRRRTAVAGGCTLGVLAVAGLAVTSLSGDDGDAPPVAVDPGFSNSTLVLTRPDGSTVAFPQVSVSCNPPEDEAGNPSSTSSGTGRIWLTSPAYFTSGEAREPFIYFEGIVRKIDGDRTFTFPRDWRRGSDRWPLTLFAADSGTRGEEGGPNEVSSAGEGAAGTVRVVEAACEPVPVLRLEVDMTLGSEVVGPTLDLAGSAG